MRQLLRNPAIVVAMICGMVSYALMNLVMTSTPLAVIGCGFGQREVSGIITAHVLAMFVPSFFTGTLIARFGVIPIIGTGLAAAGLTPFPMPTAIDLGDGGACVGSQGNWRCDICYDTKVKYKEMSC